MAETPFDDEAIAQLAVMTYEEAELDDLEVVVPAYGSKLVPDGDWDPTHGNYEGAGGRRVKLMPTANGVSVEDIGYA